MDKFDYLEKELARLLDWIKTADTRISLILPLTTAMLGAVAALTPSFTKWTWCIGISISLAVILLACSLIAISVALFPRTNGPNNSMIYFGGISSKNLEKFRSDVNDLESDKYKNDLINQCYINAKIASIKFNWVKKSLMFLLFSSIPWFYTIYILYGMR
jgi:hypothetical protein